MYTNIQKDFNKVLEYSQELTDINTNQLFSKWQEAKKDFINYFNGKLIYEWPEKVTFELEEIEKNKKINNLIEEIGLTNSDLADFISDNTNGFYKNIVLNDSISPFGEKIPKGMKLLKAFKFFEPNKDKLENFQSIASMIIQENKIEGTLCFSVHPLDFLSASENNHNWHSCHALDGDFRAGNLSYMVDNSTIMIYLKSDNDTLLPDFPNDVKWNNKKWRMWLHFSDNKDMMFAGRQYPFFSMTALNIIKDIFAKTDIGAGNHNWSNWNHKYIDNWDNDFPLDDKYLPVGDQLIGLSELIKDNPGALHYNDLLYSSYYIPYYSYKMVEDTDVFWYHAYRKKPITKITSRFKLGGGVKCIKCNNNYIKDTNTFLCSTCELQYGYEINDEICECDVCGNRAYREECIWLDKYNMWVCEQCQDKVAYCEECDEYDFTDNMILKDGHFYCVDCYHKMEDN